MQSGLIINRKILGVALIAVALSFTLAAEPVSAATGCRELAVSIGGCAGPTDESCILDYCAGQAFQDFMDRIREENRRQLKRDNKEETEEEVAEDTIGTDECDVGEGSDCTEMVFEICSDNYDAVVTFTLGGFQFYSGSQLSTNCVSASVFVQSGSTHKLRISCVGEGGGGCSESEVPSCKGTYRVISGGECVNDEFDHLGAGDSIPDYCTAD